MNDRPEWMPSEEAMDRAWGADFLVPVRSGKPNIAALVLKAGLRAQIAVLEETQTALSKFNGRPACCFEVEWLAGKIAALRKELGE